MLGRIYLITNTINNKKYIGQTHLSIEERFKEHIKCCGRKSKQFPIVRALRKYGIENFTIYELKICDTQQNLDYYETYFALQLNTFSPHGYNLKTGQGKGIVADELKAKIASSVKESWSKEIHRNRKSPEAIKLFIKSRIKSYQITSSTGNSFIITNLSQFCRDNNLRFDSMCKIANLANNKFHRGWTIIHF